jgi:hypothetical protein
VGEGEEDMAAVSGLEKRTGVSQGRRAWEWRCAWSELACQGHGGGAAQGRRRPRGQGGPTRHRERGGEGEWRLVGWLMGLVGRFRPVRVFFFFFFST